MPERADALVVFGATGDLASKKIFPALYAMARAGTLRFPVVLVGREAVELPWLVDRARKSVETRGAGLDAAAFARLAASFRYVGGDYATASFYADLRRTLDGAVQPVYYLAIPPSAFPTVVRGLGDSGCATGARIVVEKPFGRDLASARALMPALDCLVVASTSEGSSVVAMEAMERPSRIWGGQPVLIQVATTKKSKTETNPKIAPDSG